MVRHKWLGVGAARNGVQHRCFNFQEVVLHHEVSDTTDRFATRYKTGARSLVHHQIHITLPIFDFLIIDTVKLVRHGAQTLGQHTNAAGMDRQLAHTCFKQLTLAGNDVAEVPMLEVCVKFFTHVVTRDVNLDTSCAVLQSSKTCLAHHTFEHHATSDFGELAFFNQSFG